MHAFDVWLWDSIRAQQRELNELSGDEAVLSYDLGRLSQKVGQLQRTLFEMSVLNQVTLQMLSEAGHLDLDVLKYRYQAQLDEIAATRAELKLVTCSRCGRQVPAAQTTLTGDGALCDQCAPP